MNQQDILTVVYQVIQQRKGASADSSYVASLFSKGLDKILGKIGEETAEVVAAAKDGEADKIVYEVADLLFHVLVLLGHQDIEPERIYAELRRRFGVSGLAEKAAREQK
ncbi:MAG: phosphoribosyl-ATP diphosphatase [Geothermobacteraceae bacterium]